MKLRTLLASGLAAALLTSCGAGGDPNGDPDAGTGQNGGKWTVMVYLLADNDLEGAGLDDLVEMMDVGSGGNLTLLAQVDRAQGEAAGAVGGLADWVGAKRLRVEKGSLTELEDLGATNMADPATLTQFVDWAAKTAPAENYVLVLWDHGGAWPQYGVDFGSSNAGLNLKQMKAAISDGMQQAGIAKFKVIGFDACLMATYETALALQGLGDYLLASEEVEPGHGWDYHSFQILADDPTTSTVDLGRRISEGFYAQAQQNKTADTITLSLVDLAKVDAVRQAVDALATALSAPAVVVKTGAQRQATLEFAKNPDPTRSTHMIDLAHFAANMGTADGSLSASTKAVRDAVTAAVAANKTGAAYQRATGISIYFPPMQNLYDAKYDQVQDVGGWRGFLKAYYAAGVSGVHPTFTDANHEGTLNLDGGTLYLTGQLAAGGAPSVVSALTSFGLVAQTGEWILLGDRPAALDASGQVTGAWDLQVLSVSQGGSVDYGYLSEAYTDSGLQLMVPFAYLETAAAAPELIVMMVLLDASGNEKSRTFYAQVGEAWGELTPRAGSSVKTVVQMMNTEGSISWELFYDVALDPNQALDFGFAGLNPGATVMMMNTVSDASGQSDYVYGGGTLP